MAARSNICGFKSRDTKAFTLNAYSPSSFQYVSSVSDVSGVGNAISASNTPGWVGMLTHAATGNNYKKIKIYSAYLGEVELDAYDHGNGNVSLQTIIKGINGEPDIFVKELDSEANGLKPEVYNYNAGYLVKQQPTVINVESCKNHYDIICYLEKKLETGPLPDSEQKQLHLSYIHNNAVDIHFNTCQYIHFLHECLNTNNVVASNVLISIHNVPQLDNAFFTGEVMVYGNGGMGKSGMFYPLGTSDIGGHELGHGLVQKCAGLEYRGHAGALNEHYADVMGVCFEFYLYDKFNTDADSSNDLKNCSDWTIGEDSGKSIKYLRNMKNPLDAEFPQPKSYKGQYWINPNDMNNDHGGVHSNSGVGNFCFYNLSTSIGTSNALDIFYKCLNTLTPTASYLEFRDKLLMASPSKFRNKTDISLRMCGLTSRARSDWRV